MSKFSYSIFDRDGNPIDKGKFWVGLTEYYAQNWPEGMEGCRMFRIEYGGVNEGQATEGEMWLPPTASVEEVEDFLQSLFQDWDEQEFRQNNPDSGFLSPR